MQHGQSDVEDSTTLSACPVLQEGGYSYGVQNRSPD